MKKLAAALLLALAIALPAVSMPPGQLWPVLNTNGRKPVCFIYDSDVIDSAQASVAADNVYGRSFLQTENLSLGCLKTLLQEQGNEFHVYPSSYFKCNGAGAAAYATLGNTYSVIVGMGFRCTVGGVYVPDTARILRFFDPDSTNAQIIQCGFSDHWDDGGRFGTGTDFGGTQPSAQSPLFYLNTRGLAFTSTASGDTIYWFAAVGRAILNRSIYPTCGYDSTNQRVRKIVRLFNPALKVNGYTGANNTGAKIVSDTLEYTGAMIQSCRNDSSKALYADSLVHGVNTMLPLAWRVYWQSGAHVDYVPILNNTQTGQAYIMGAGEILLSLISRYAVLDPIRVGYEWDDHGTFGFDDNSTNQRQWPYPDTLNAWRAFMASYGLSRIETTGGADSLYRMATQRQNGKIYPSLFASQWRFVPHVHDTTTGVDSAGVYHPLGSVLGMGSQIACANGNTYSPDHRLAFRDTAIAPGVDNSASGVYDYMKKGIYQRLVQQDSAYTAAFGPGHTAPYLSFPNDISAPLDSWNGSAGSLSYYTNGKTGSGAGCVPRDSLMLAFACAGKLYIRANVAGQYGDSAGNGGAHGPAWTQMDGSTHLKPTGYGPWTPGSTQAWSTTTSSGNGYYDREFDYSSERYIGYNAPAAFRGRNGIRTNGTFEVRCISTESLTATSLDSVTSRSDLDYSWRSGSLVILPELLGLRRPNVAGYKGDLNIGEKLVPTSIGRSGTNGYFRSTDNNRVRMLYQHPLSSNYFPYNVENRGEVGDEKAMKVSVLWPLAALNNLASHSLITWVYPWEVFTR